MQIHILTEVAFMAQQAQFLISFIFLILVFGCQNKQDSIQLNRTENINNGNFHNINGILFLDNKPYSGYLYSLYPNSKDTMEVKGYEEGKEHGTWKKYSKNGVLTEKRFFITGSKEGEMKTWWPTGKIQSICNFKNNEYEGNLKQWNNQRQLILNLNYKKGHEDGVQQMFYDNGKVRSNYVIENGRRYGLLGTKNCINVSDSIFKN